MKYVSRAKDILKREIATLDGIEENMRKAKADYEAERITGKIFDEKNNQFKADMNAVKMDAISEVKALLAESIAELESNSVMTGDQVNGDAQIIQSGVKITPVQFNALVERNRGNEFVSTLLREYAAAHAETLGDVTLPATVEGRIMNCEKYLRIASEAVRDPYSIRAGLVLDGKCDPEY
jgi:hypothetical protein